MANKTNCEINGKSYFKIKRKVGRKLNSKGKWVDNYKQFYGRSKREAEDKYKEYMSGGSSGSDKCLAEIIDQWKSTVFDSCDLASGTKATYSAPYMRLFRDSDIARRKINDVTALDLQKFFNDAKAPYNTLKCLYKFLRRFYSYAELNGLCSDITGSVTVPADNAHPAKSTIEIWPKEDLKKLLDQLTGNTLRFLVILAVNTGCRFSELLALTYDDIRDGQLIINKQVCSTTPDGYFKQSLTKPKTASSNRIIPLSAQVLAELDKHKRLQKKQMKKYGYITRNLFTTTTGSYYFRRNVSRQLEYHCKLAGVQYHHFHAFRDTFATILSEAGTPIEEVAALLGHSDISTTAKYYVHVNINRKQTAVEKAASYAL